MMFEKLAGKGALMRLVTVLLIASVAILVVANDLTKGVATLYRIPVSSVIVFEKEQEG